MGEQEKYEVLLYSFGYKYDLLPKANLVLDVRSLPNPYWVSQLRDKNGLSQEVADYVLENESTSNYLSRLLPMIDWYLEHYQQQRKRPLTIAIGCTGGCHRSVALVEYLKEHIRKQRELVRVIHRDVTKDSTGPCG